MVGVRVALMCVCGHDKIPAQDFTANHWFVFLDGLGLVFQRAT